MTAAEGGSGGGDIEKLAGTLCRRAGFGPPVALDHLSGGRNNRVIRLALADGRRAVMKCYHHDPRDGRDRLAAEWNFLAYAVARSVTEVPEPLTRDLQARAALFSFVEGRKLEPGAVSADHVAHALAFVRQLNGDRREPTCLAPGSEACFSLAAHLATVERRLARLDGIESESELHEQARFLVATRVRPAWQAVCAHAVDAAQRMRLTLDEALPVEAVCVSPSDFGFHNALVDDAGRVTFIDFEYAGHDDPAKLLCDFFCQPEFPVPISHLDGFANGVMTALGLDERHYRRVHVLLDVYRVKWVCIMLNDFLPTDSARRAFADAGPRTERLQQQLARAAEALSAIGAT